MLLVVLYFVACAVVGHIGNNHPGGFMAWMIVSILFTPVIGLLILILMMFYARAAIRRKEQRQKDKLESQ
jgi:uncharacterized membrane protein